MKNFVKENWYKLMIGSSMMMASFGFMIYAVSPAYSNSDKEKTEIKNTGIPNSPVGANGLQMGDAVIFIDGGYVYYQSDLARYPNQWNNNSYWQKHKLP
jgi:hypothetical protein